jgi:hypothetical protein
MLEPSLALIKRHQTDQHRLKAENELKLQHQLSQLWQKIGGLERHAQQSDLDKAALRQRLLKVEAENTALKDRLKRLEKSMWATERSSKSPQTVIPSGVATPNVITRGQETAHVDDLSGALDPVILHPTLPKLLFVLNPVENVLSDGSEFPLSMLSSLRSMLAEMLDDEDVDTGRIARLNNVAGNAFTTKEKCLYRYLQKSFLGEAKTVWTKEHRHLYACRTRVNMRRLCITIDKGQLLVLPLHPLLRTLRGDDRFSGKQMSNTDKADPYVLPTELHYWIATRAWLTWHAPYNADIWSVPIGHH